MRLTLTPPPSYPIPDTLQTHILRPPTLPNRIKTPLPYLRVKRSLGDVGLSLPSLLCADRTLWWSLAVEEVTWDLETEMVEVRFVDGTEERWDLDPEAAFKSDDFVEDSDDEDSKMDLDNEAIEKAFRAAMTSTIKEVKGKGKSPSPPPAIARRSPPSVQSRLHSLCVQLRDAYEDLALGSVPIADEHDYLQLLDMAADPSARIPPEWSNQSLLEFHMKGSSDDECEMSDMSDGSEDERLLSPRKARRRILSPELGEEKDDKAEKKTVINRDFDISTSIRKKSHHKGQLKSRRRPASLAPVASSSTSPLPPARHDYLSFVSLLSTARRTLLDLFSSAIIPSLKDRLDTPTYALWAVSNATRWCRQEAILKGGEVAGDLLRLLHDDGESFDMTDEEDEDELNEKSDEEEWALRRGFPSSQESAGARRERRLKRNPLYELRDDYDLKMWCEKAQARARGIEMEGDNDLAGWSVDRGDDLLSSVGAPRFTQELQPWEVSKPYPSPHLTSSMIKKKSLDFVALAAKLSTPTKSKSKSNQPLPPPPSARSTSMMQSLYLSHPSTDASPPLTDCSDDEYFESGSLHGPAFFCPEDVLSESFLPPRLPKALVKSSPAMPLGKEMEMMRKKVHQELNEIAGLQKKLKELLEYSAKHSDDYEKARTEERRAKPLEITELSSLRHLGSPTSSPPRPSSPVSSIPLTRQPLRLRVADNSLSAALDSHLGADKRADKRAAVIADSAKQQTRRGFGNAHQKQPASPRKRARDNLTTIYKATGRSALSHSGSAGEVKKEGKSKKRKAAREEEDVIAKMRRRQKSKKQKVKGSGVRVREDVDVQELAQLATTGQGSSTASPVLGTFPHNSFPHLTPFNPLQFPPKPHGALTSAFVLPLTSASVVATSFASPPLTPPSSPPDSLFVPFAPRLTPQALNAHRRVPLAEPHSTSSRADADADVPMILNGWQDTYRGGEASDEDDEAVEDILVDAAEELKWSSGEEIDSDDGEDCDADGESDEDDVEGVSETSRTSPVSDTFDIPVDLGAEDDSSDEEVDTSFFPRFPATEPDRNSYLSSPPFHHPTTVSADFGTIRHELAPRTPSSFPKSFGSVSPLSFVPSALTPTSSTSNSAQQLVTTAFPTSFERDGLQQFSPRIAADSVIDPTLAALSLDSTTFINSTSIPAPTPATSFVSVEHKLWSPIPLRPPKPPSRLTSTTPLPTIASLLSDDVPINPNPIPAPTLLLTPAPEPASAVSSAGIQLQLAMAPSLPFTASSSRFVAKVTSPLSLPAVIESPFEVEMDSGEEESSQGEERKEVCVGGAGAFVEPATATARAQAGALFIGRMLVGEQQRSQTFAAEADAGGGGGGSGEAQGGSEPSAPA